MIDERDNNPQGIDRKLCTPRFTNYKTRLQQVGQSNFNECRSNIVSLIIMIACLNDTHDGNLSGINAVCIFIFKLNFNIPYNFLNGFVQI